MCGWAGKEFFLCLCCFAHGCERASLLSSSFRRQPYRFPIAFVAHDARKHYILETAQRKSPPGRCLSEALPNVVSTAFSMPASRSIAINRTTFCPFPHSHRSALILDRLKATPCASSAHYQSKPPSASTTATSREVCQANTGPYHAGGYAKIS